MLTAVFSVLRPGGQWRRMPHDLPQGKAGPPSCRVWRQRGGWRALPNALRTALRVALGRAAHPRAGGSGSQRVKTAGGGGARGDDGAKKLKGRTRHLSVDTQGGSEAKGIRPTGGTETE